MSSQFKIQGRYLSGKTSRDAQAELEVFSEQSLFVVTSDPDARIRVNMEDVKIASRLGNTPREIHLGEGRLFLTNDHEAVDRLAQSTRRGHSTWLHTLESNFLVIMLALVVTISLVSAFILYGIPKSAEYIAHNFPDFTVEKFSDGLLVLDETLFEPSKLEDQQKQRLEGVFAPILEAHSALNPRVFFRSGVGANAFALPNGEIVFTDELIALAEKDEELIAVLLHELGHLQHKHMARRAIQDVMMTLMALFIIGDIGSMDLATAIPTLLLDLSYSREFEREADRYAVEQLKASGMSPESFVSVMHKLHDQAKHKSEQKADDQTKQKHVILDYLSTHPRIEERIAIIQGQDQH